MRKVTYWTSFGLRKKEFVFFGRVKKRIFSQTGRLCLLNKSCLVVERWEVRGWGKGSRASWWRHKGWCSYSLIYIVFLSLVSFLSFYLVWYFWLKRNKILNIYMQFLSECMKIDCEIDCDARGRHLRFCLGQQVTQGQHWYLTHTMHADSVCAMIHQSH